MSWKEKGNPAHYEFYKPCWQWLFF